MVARGLPPERVREKKRDREKKSTMRLQAFKLFVCVRLVHLSEQPDILGDSRTPVIQSVFIFLIVLQCIECVCPTETEKESSEHFH